MQVRVASLLFKTSLRHLRAGNDMGEGSDPMSQSVKILGSSEE